MSAAKQVKYSLLTALSAAPEGTARSGERKMTPSAQARRPAKMRAATAAERPALEPVISVSGTALPDVLVEALKSYVPSGFKTKSKDDLLAMLVNPK